MNDDKEYIRKLEQALVFYGLGEHIAFSEYGFIEFGGGSGAEIFTLGHRARRVLSMPDTPYQKEETIKLNALGDLMAQIEQINRQVVPTEKAFKDV